MADSDKLASKSVSDPTDLKCLSSPYSAAPQISSKHPIFVAGHVPQHLIGGQGWHFLSLPEARESTARRAITSQVANQSGVQTLAPTMFLRALPEAEPGVSLGHCSLWPRNQTNNKDLNKAAETQFCGQLDWQHSVSHGSLLKDPFGDP